MTTISRLSQYRRVVTAAALIASSPSAVALAIDTYQLCYGVCVIATAPLIKQRNPGAGAFFAGCVYGCST